MTNENTDEHELINGVLQGDRAAMKMLYTQNIGALTAVCSRYIDSDDDVKDVLQDCFIRIFTLFAQFEYRGPGSVRAWMTRIVVNESLDFIRRSSKGSLQDVAAMPDVPDDENTDPDPDDVPPEVVHAMIRNLPPGYRSVFNLYVFEEKSHKDIASMLGISENTSSSQLHRAKKILAQQIQQYKTTHQWKKNG